MTLREEILEYLEKKPATSNELCKRLGRDRTSIKRVLADLKRRGKVKMLPEQKGKVLYNYFLLESNKS